MFMPPYKLEGIIIFSNGNVLISFVNWKFVMNIGNMSVSTKNIFLFV